MPLDPGVHYVRLTNPYFHNADREVQIREGETEVVDVTLDELPSEDE